MAGGYFGFCMEELESPPFPVSCTPSPLHAPWLPLSSVTLTHMAVISYSVVTLFWILPLDRNGSILENFSFPLSGSGFSSESFIWPAVLSLLCVNNALVRRIYVWYVG